MAQRVRMKDGGSLVAVIADEVRALRLPRPPALEHVHWLTSVPSPCCACCVCSCGVGHDCWFSAGGCWQCGEGQEHKLSPCDHEYVDSSAGETLSPGDFMVAMHGCRAEVAEWAWKAELDACFLVFQSAPPGRLQANVNRVCSLFRVDSLCCGGCEGRDAEESD